jgi:hypothetical protein
VKSLSGAPEEGAERDSTCRPSTCPTARGRQPGRQALKLATSHQALVDDIRPGLASVGNGFTPVGPAFGRYYLVRPPFANLARARALLAEAGYPGGLEITLHVQNQAEALSIAAVWMEQLARIGVEVHPRVIASEQYYGGGSEDWLKVDFGITDWGARATPVSYFKLAYATGAPWNETHWSDRLHALASIETTKAGGWANRPRRTGSNAARSRPTSSRPRPGYFRASGDQPAPTAPHLFSRRLVRQVGSSMVLSFEELEFRL